MAKEKSYRIRVRKYTWVERDFMVEATSVKDAKELAQKVAGFYPLLWASGENPTNSWYKVLGRVKEE